MRLAPILALLAASCGEAPGAATSAPGPPSAAADASRGEASSAPPAATRASEPRRPVDAGERAPGADAHARGLWIWELGHNGPDASRAAELAARWGVRRVFLKSGNGDSRQRWARNFSARNRAPFLERGIELWGFAYVYGEGVPDEDGRTWGTIDEQVDAVADATFHEGVAGLVVDAEVELVGKPEDARRLCAGLRARLLPGQRLAYTSFGWIQRWPGFPFEELDRGCGDAFLPQVYSAHGWPGGHEGSLARLRDGVAARGLRAPVWPVQTNMPDPPVTSLEDFFRRAGPDASVFFLHREDTEQTRRLGLVDWSTR